MLSCPRDQIICAAVHRGIATNANESFKLADAVHREGDFTSLHLRPFMHSFHSLCSLSAGTTSR
jgi:hypothetical protein